MNIVERDTPRALDHSADASQVSPALASETPSGRRLRPLVSLLPYVGRYRWQAGAALVALLAAAITTLVVGVVNWFPSLMTTFLLCLGV
jgi:hypothetical protein